MSNFATPALEEDATRGMNVAMEETWDGKPIAAEPPYGAMVLVYRVELGSGPFCSFSCNLCRRTSLSSLDGAACLSESGACNL